MMKGDNLSITEILNRNFKRNKDIAQRKHIFKRSIYRKDIMYTLHGILLSHWRTQPQSLGVFSAAAANLKAKESFVGVLEESH